MREEKKLSQDELAKMTGYTSRSSIAKIEKGEVDLTRSKIIAFAEALGTTPADLMGWKIEKKTLLLNPFENEGNQSVAIQNVNDGIAIIHKKESYEAQVLDEMKKLTLRGKSKLLETAREMTFNPLYNDHYENELNAAHERTDIEVTDEMRKHDDDIMYGEDF